MKKLLLFLSSTLLLASCLPRNVQVPQSPLLPMLERKSGLIAYIGADWNIYTSDQAGKKLTAYTDNAEIPTDTSKPFRYYVYPTWSPDAGRLGFVGVSGEGSISGSEVYIADVGEDAKKVFTSDTQHPFYLYWSPDSENLGLLTTTSNGQSMILQSVSTERKDSIVIDTGAPYYWSWAPDGKTMIVHTGSTQTSAPEHMAFLKVGSDITEDGLEETPTSFQAPAWSPDGQQILMTRLNDQKEKEIILTDAHGKFEKVLGKFQMNTAFVWSNNGDQVAYIEGKESLGAGTLGTLHVIDLETSKDLFHDDNVLAFFWSPNDEKIAYFIPMINTSNSSSGQGNDSSSQQQQQLLLQLKVLDVKTGESKELYTFQPTEQFAAILPYFDQYAQSSTIWSPDNNNLVLCFVTSEGAPGIAIAAASGQLEPRLLTQGYLAFWSPK